jgi:hypothetical protein
MKAFSLTFIFISSAIMAANCQITNPGFEEWEIDGSYEVPTGWHNEETYCFNGDTYVIKDTISYEGQFSLKFRGVCPAFEGGYQPAVLSQEFTFPDNSLPSSFSFWIKILNIEESEGVTAGCGSISILYFYEEGSNGGDSWFINTEEEITDWTKVEIPLANIDTSKTIDYFRIQFWGGSCNGSLGFEGNSDFLIDAVSELSTSSRNIVKDEIQIFPNPASDIITIKGSKHHKLELFTVTGVLIKTINNFNLSDKLVIDLTTFEERVILLKFTNTLSGNEFVKRVIKHDD